MPRSRSVTIFYFLIIAVYLVIAVKAFYPPVQKLFMAQFHLRYDSPKDFPRWAALQIVPSMYNFSNELWYLDHRVNQFTELSVPGIHHRWFNHYPLRFVSFGNYRNLFLTAEKEQFIYLASCYRYNCLRTNYEIILEGNVIHLERF